MVMSFQSAPEKLPRRPAVCDPTFPGKQVGYWFQKEYEAINGMIELKSTGNDCPYRSKC
jgi:hypothetical protein